MTIEPDEFTAIYAVGFEDGRDRHSEELERLTKNLEDATEIIKDRMEEIYALRIRNIKLKADRDGLREIIKKTADNMFRYDKTQLEKKVISHEAKIKEME